MVQEMSQHLCLSNLFIKSFSDYEQYVRNYIENMQ
jgi:hypothetical protein